MSPWYRGMDRSTVGPYDTAQNSGQVTGTISGPDFYHRDSPYDFTASSVGAHLSFMLHGRMHYLWTQVQHL